MRTQLRNIVGEIAIAFAQLEHVLWILPKRIQKLSMREWADLAEKASIPTRCAQIRKHFAVMHMDQDRESDLDRLLKRVERVNEERNRVIHGRWGNKKGLDGSIVSHHRIWKNEDLRIDIDQLAALRDEIRWLRDNLQRFIRPSA